jgi:hypothetical protein
MISRATFPLAYHITWGTYGTRLHGDERGTVDRSANVLAIPSSVSIEIGNALNLGYCGLRYAF